MLNWVGATYAIWLGFIWLGFKLIRSALRTELAPIKYYLGTRGVFAHASVVTALNPKSIIFFISFVPHFLRPKESLMPRFVFLIATYVGLAALNAPVYAFLIDYLRRVVGKLIFLIWITRAGGVTLVGMGDLTAALRRTT